MLDYSKSFIETQFPVSKISKESYKERKSVQGQTLTGLGKWWGRKPLILVRATILGTLMPVSTNPIKDRDIFLKILTMDDEGLWLRKSKKISKKDIFKLLNPIEREKYFDVSSTEKKQNFKDAIDTENKEYLNKLVFNRMSYDVKLNYCDRPENVKITNNDEWTIINRHLETNANSIEKLIKELGEKRYGHKPKIGDCFAGGGSIPFESARIGADVFASDLNPVAMLLNELSLSLLTLKKNAKEELLEFQEKIFNQVDNQIKEFGFETNECGHRADAYLYCNESFCPECGVKNPLTASWVIGVGSKTIATPKFDGNNSFDIVITQNASDAEMKSANDLVTVRMNKLICLNCGKETPISSLRGDIKDNDGNNISGLRKWEKGDFIPQGSDVFQERLYAIRYVGDNGRYYTSPTERDISNELSVIKYIQTNFVEWQENGFIPSNKIEPGDKTDEPIRTRGWQYWHQLFSPRQLLYIGLLAKNIDELSINDTQRMFGIAGINRVSDWSSKLCRWGVGQARESIAQTFYNQAFNTMYQYGVKGFRLLKGNWTVKFTEEFKGFEYRTQLTDARVVSEKCDVWITDPPYADAVNYHELTEFFLAWDDKLLKKSSPSWYTDSKRVLAVKGTGQSFNESMIDIYSNLSKNMTVNGSQVVMFTHQDVKVWSELAMILWSAGLQVTSAWNIATETEATGIKKGNYVKGTVLLNLKKQSSKETAFQDELYDEIKYEVKSIIDSMREIDDKDDPDFTDADYLLASYASSLKILTAYKEIEGIDVKYWLSQPRDSKEENPVEALINKAVRIAYDYLIPEGFDKSYWKDLKPEERFYIRGLEVEISGTLKISSYQELARGFGVNDYTDMFENFKANSARLKTPSEYRMAYLNGEGFGSTLLRNLLVAINETTTNKSTIEGRAYLKDTYQEDNQYWYKKPLMIELLSFLSNLELINHMPHWKEHAYSAKLLKEALKNEGV